MPRHSTAPTKGTITSLPKHWMAMYDDFVIKNAGQVSQIESALRSLTYVIPGLSGPDLRPPPPYFFLGPLSSDEGPDADGVVY